MFYIFRLAVVYGGGEERGGGNKVAKLLFELVNGRVFFIALCWIMNGGSIDVQQTPPPGSGGGSPSWPGAGCHQYQVSLSGTEDSGVVLREIVIKCRDPPRCLCLIIIILSRPCQLSCS